MPQNPLEEFFNKFLKPPKGNSPEDILNRARHWIDVANRPEDFVGDDASPYARRAKRRSARQNLRRLVQKHPHVIQMLRDLGHDSEQAS